MATGQGPAALGGLVAGVVGAHDDGHGVIGLARQGVAQLAGKLAELAPGDLNRVHFTTGDGKQFGIYHVVRNPDGSFKPEHTYWRGFPNRTAAGLRLEHAAPGTK